MSAADLADENLVEAVREHARWQDPCEMLEQDGLLLVAGATAFPGAFRNCAIRTDPRLDAGTALERARGFFADRRRGFTFIVRAGREADLMESHAGIAPAGEAPCMVVEKPLEGDSVADAERFQTIQHVLDAVEINAEAYDRIKLPAAETRAYFSKPEALLSPRIAGFVAYRDGRPASTALAILGKAAGVYWVGTTSAAARRRLGESCTRLATNAAFAAGAAAVTLQASPFGEPLYRRLGFRSCDRMLRYRHPAPP